ncbi:hypothetical protein VKT23_000742 [Stygiomarasmius scandens]|uniref:GH16 domain-containing protein n=1 Tax=Marasmiellus scandens TaxID=2682957 RepID=A0ABR1K578_9AGAR
MLNIPSLIFHLSSLFSIAVSQQEPQVFQISNAPLRYTVQRTYIGNDFYNLWIWKTFDDPTHGRVNYVDRQTSIEKNLTYASEDKFIMKADSSEIVPPESRGRDSIRIESIEPFSEALIILDLQHAPTGCATWPAFWTLSQKGPWPKGGEIDVIEGVNQNTKNLASLHTLPNCIMPDIRSQAGQTISNNCDSAFNFNQGCGVVSVQETSYGSGFNACGGGWYAMERSILGIKIWSFSRCNPPPPELQNPSLPINTAAWPLPDAFFPFAAESCSYSEHFDPHNMVFDITFCGDWAGNAFPSSGCGPSECAVFVDQNPGAFSEAYWEINSLRVYTPF